MLPLAKKMTFLTIFGILWFLNFTWDLQINFGNYLKHTHSKSKLRKIWWSMCDQIGYCNFCIESYMLYHETLEKYQRKINFKK